MSLLIHVRLEANGLVGEDDGDSAWRSTTITYGCGNAAIVSDILVNAYSGELQVIVSRDDYRLPLRLAAPLTIALYRICGVVVRGGDCDIGEAICNVEMVIRHIFYRADAQALLRRFRSALARSKGINHVPPSTATT